MALYKFLRTGLKSEHGDVAWKIGEWQHIEGKLIPCENGFHCSKRPYDAFKYVHGSILAEVEIDADFIEEEDKLCSKSMKIIKAWKWSKKDSVELAIFAAQSVLDIYENKYPNDNRPRRTIEAAQAWLDAGYAASDAAYAAYAAAYAAGDGAYTAAYAAIGAANNAAAGAAAYAAGDGAYTAAYAAYAAGNAAYAADAASAGAAASDAAAAASAAAYAAATAAYKQTLNDWMVNRISQLNEL